MSTYFILLAYTRTMLRSTFTAMPGSIAEVRESWKDARYEMCARFQIARSLLPGACRMVW